MKKFISILISFVIMISCAVNLTGCNNQIDENNNSDKLKIVTTIFPYYDIAKGIAGDKAEIKLLLSPGNEPHSYDPSPSDIVAIENCDVFIYNGGESDEWVESVLESLQNDSIKILCMMDYADKLYEQEPDHSEGDEFDEHIWTSVSNMMELSRVAAETFSECDIENSEYYSANETEYISKLEILETEFKNIVSNANKKTIVFGDRFPFLYFVTEFGIDYECAFPGCSSETEPSIATVTHLIDYVRDEQIPVVFYLEFSNGKVANLIAEDSTAKTIQFYSCHNVTKEQFENGETYFSLMEQNAKSLEEALS